MELSSCERHWNHKSPSIYSKMLRAVAETFQSDNLCTIKIAVLRNGNRFNEKTHNKECTRGSFDVYVALMEWRKSFCSFSLVTMSFYDWILINCLQTVWNIYTTEKEHNQFIESYRNSSNLVTVSIWNDLQ